MSIFAAAQTSQHFEAIHPWQHHIEHDEIACASASAFSQGGLAIVDHEQARGQLQ